ncbi:MAG: DUF5671 domain-containing protein [Chloroflexi bacterium]|nr:DUF5671 domain-containing protein [Chloroflexota bacterium]
MFFDSFFFILGILGSIIPIALIGLIVYGIVVWRRRASEHAPEDDMDPGIGTVRRLYFYFVAFVSLMMTASGIVMLLQFVLDSITGDNFISDSTTRLAAGASLLIVGAPLWVLHWRYIQKQVAEIPTETRSILRKLYIYITLAVTGSILIYTALNLLNWIFRTDDFSGYDLAALIVWGVVWAFHWLVEEREGQSSPETIAIRRLYIYIASLAGLVMLSIGVGRVLYFILLEGYNALVSTPVISGDSGLLRHAMREMLAVAIVGAATWALHWLYIARRDYDSVLRQVYLYIFAILGGVMTTLVALGIIIHEFLTWLFGTYSADSVAQHFEFLPGAVAPLSIGAALWAYHWYRVRHETGTSGGTTLSARRAYTYILAAIGTGTLAVAVFMLVGAALKLILAQFGDVVIGGDQWKRPLINIITLAVLGVPVWGYYWRNIQTRAVELGADERQATSRRIFIFAALGIGVLALLGSVSVLLFFVLRDLLELALSLDTLGDMTSPIAVIAAAAVFLPYYWSIYRQDRQQDGEDAERDATRDETAEVAPQAELDAPDVSVAPETSDAPALFDTPEIRHSRKQVTLLAPAGSEIVAPLQDALGYEVQMLLWADTDVATPTLTDDDHARLAQAIAAAPGSRILLVPDGEGLRVLSYEGNGVPND